ncbi:hypothetical protein KR038_006753 [Drosophila bunnanda]|nr:hypothetical protein KR038_006753 [Drosophila bunnanda]
MSRQNFRILNSAQKFLTKNFCPGFRNLTKRLYAGSVPETVPLPETEEKRRVASESRARLTARAPPSVSQNLPGDVQKPVERPVPHHDPGKLMPPWRPVLASNLIVQNEILNKRPELFDLDNLEDNSITNKLIDLLDQQKRLEQTTLDHQDHVRDVNEAKHIVFREVPRMRRNVGGEQTSKLPWARDLGPPQYVDSDDFARNKYKLQIGSESATFRVTSKILNMLPNLESLQDAKKSSKDKEQSEESQRPRKVLPPRNMTKPDDASSSTNPRNVTTRKHSIMNMMREKVPSEYPVNVVRSDIPPLTSQPSQIALNLQKDRAISERRNEIQNAHKPRLYSLVAQIFKCG